MKVVLVSLNFAPEPTGIGKYSGELADAWVAQGHEVVVVCAPPFYPAWTRAEGYGALGYQRERVSDRLTVIRCPIHVPHRLTGKSRLIHLASFAVSSLPVLLALVAWRPALVFAVAPALSSAPAAWLLARLSGAKAWLHLQDFELDAAFELGLLRGPRVRRVLEGVERRLLRGFDAVSSISRQMVRRVVAKGVRIDRVELLPNAVDLDLIRPGARSLALLEELGIATGAFVGLFSGTINRKQGVDLLIEAARLLRDHPRIVIVICGNGEFRPEVERAAVGLDNVRFIDLRPPKALNDLLNIAHVHLLPQRGGASDLVMPSKLTGMLASGRAVIASAMPGTEIARVVEGCGVRVEPESPEAFAEGLRALAADPDLCERLGRAGRFYAERNLGAATLMRQLDVRMADLCAAHGDGLMAPTDAVN